MTANLPPPPPLYRHASPKVADFVRTQLLPDYTKSTQNLYLHLYLSTDSAFKNDLDGAVPISMAYRRKHFRTSVDKKEVEQLRSYGLLNISGYDLGRKKSRRYWIPIGILTKLTKLRHEDLKHELLSLPESWQLQRKKVKTNSTTTYINSKLVKQAINSIDGGIMNHSAALQKIGDNLEGLDFMPDQKKVISKCIHDIHNLIKASNNCIIVNGILEYKQNYKPGATGRIFEVGGFQSISRDVKKAAMKDIQDVYNYDIRSSQIAALCQVVQTVGIDPQILVNYLDNPASKIDYAIKCGFVDEKGTPQDVVWKKCLMSLVFGGSMTEFFGAPYKTIKEFDQENAGDLFLRFQEVVKPFLVLINKWYDKLDRYLELHSHNHKHGRFFTNAAGVRINLDTDDIARDKKKLSAFILQGLESSFIHHLTLLSEDYGFRVISNEHDGLVTIGTISSEAIQKAKKESGFKLASLELKDF
jgi:hypothetical protein